MYCTGTVRVLGGGVGDRVGDQGAVGRPALRTCTMYEIKYFRKYIINRAFIIPVLGQQYRP